MIAALMGRLSSATFKQSLKIQRWLNVTPMQQILKKLEARGVAVRTLKAIELFGAYGKLHTIDYASRVSSLEVWEIEPKYEPLLHRNLPGATVRITDSYAELPRHAGRYDLLVVDSPEFAHGSHYEHFDLFPGLFRLCNDNAILILNIIPGAGKGARKRLVRFFDDAHLKRRANFYRTTSPENLPLEEMVNRYREICREQGFNVEWDFYRRRGYSYAYYLVIKLGRPRPAAAEKSAVG